MPLIRLARVALVARDVEALAAFYIDVLGFERIGDEPGIALRLGDSRLDLLAAKAGAPPCSPDVAGWDPSFQHCAIVVDDMARAMERLQSSTAWSPISTDGPETLPPNTGNVTAFKFRDPEGHPLELLQFAGHEDAQHARPFVCIDHSAISVADVACSIAFYGSLGLKVTGRSLNEGVEQQRLDDVADATVDVVALSLPDAPRPHVELLGYRGSFDRDGPLPAIGDVAATRLVFEVDGREALMTIVIAHAQRLVDVPVTSDRRSALLRDPDGHVLELRIAR